MAFAYFRLPATNCRQTREMRWGSLSSPISDSPLPASSSDTWKCAPQPAAPLMGFDMNEPISPWRAAISLTAFLNV